MRVPQIRISAGGNWWGGGEPRIYNSDNEAFKNSGVEFDPVLRTDPR